MAKVKEITWQEAEDLIGHAVDRRRKYARDGKQLLEICRFTHSCSGCFESGDYGGNEHNYPWDDKAQCRLGSGCSECGHQGKVRQSMWVPYVTAERQRRASADHETPYV